jgi:hypothetical protein
MSMPTTAKYEFGASMRSGFSWTFPGAPIRINIPLGLISRLQAELNEHEDLANSSPGAEIGGVLLGHQTAPSTLDIDDYVWVSSEEPAGSPYHLARSELGFLRSVYDAPVGYFRTQSEDNLYLREEEIDFVGKHFRDRTDVVLLIRTSPEPYTAGFFFWTKEGVFAPLSLMDFPLDAELLQFQGIRISQPTEEEETTQPLPATTAKDAVAPLESASTSVEEPISAHAEDVSIGLRLRSHLERLWGRHSTSQAASGQLEQTEAAETTPPRTAATSKNTPVGVSKRMLVAAGAVFAVLALAGLSAFLLRDQWLSAPRQKSAATAAAFPLQLDVEELGNGLNIRWNPQSAPVTQAREGRLVILEGDQRPRIVPLDPQQLTRGHVYYRSSTERLRFQLEILNASGEVTRESVLALTSKPSPAVTPVAPPNVAGQSRPFLDSPWVPSGVAGVLFVVLSIAALICDFLKGKQLRALMIELDARREEEQLAAQSQAPRSVSSVATLAKTMTERQVEVPIARFMTAPPERKRTIAPEAWATIERGARMAGAPRQPGDYDSLRPARPSKRPSTKGNQG